MIEMPASLTSSSMAQLAVPLTSSPLGLTGRCWWLVEPLELTGGGGGGIRGIAGCVTVAGCSVPPAPPPPLPNPAAVKCTVRERVCERIFF